MSNTKFDYLMRSVLNVNQESKCPCCGSTSQRVIDRKYVVTTLRECLNCHFYYRHPVDKSTFNEQFYQEDYVEKGLTTDLPGDKELKSLMANLFKGTVKDFSFHIKFIKDLFSEKKNIRILDYGANWGYASYQFKESGFDVESYEISRHKAKFASKLGVEVKTNESEIGKDFDVFFSSHVIEHHSDVTAMIELAKNVLSDSGIFIAFCPNGSDEFRKEVPAEFHSLWGMVHPNYLNNKYYQTVFKSNPYLVCSDVGYPKVKEEWDNVSQKTFDLSGPELLVIAALNKVIDKK